MTLRLFRCNRCGVLAALEPGDEQEYLRWHAHPDGTGHAMEPVTIGEVGLHKFWRVFEDRA